MRSAPFLSELVVITVCGLLLFARVVAIGRCRLKWNDGWLDAHTTKRSRTPAKSKLVTLMSAVRSDMSPDNAPRRSVAKDRTVKRLLRELVALGERVKQRRVVTLSLRLRQVLLRCGHDV